MRRLPQACSFWTMPLNSDWMAMRGGLVPPDGNMRVKIYMLRAQKEGVYLFVFYMRPHPSDPTLLRAASCPRLAIFRKAMRSATVKTKTRALPRTCQAASDSLPHSPSHYKARISTTNGPRRHDMRCFRGVCPSTTVGCRMASGRRWESGRVYKRPAAACTSIQNRESCVDACNKPE